MFEALRIQKWYREYAPFRCRGCGGSGSYAVEGAHEPPPDFPGFRRAATLAEAIHLRCDYCGVRTRFPVARIQHMAAIRLASRIADARGLPVRICPRCGGWGACERPPEPGRGPEDVDDPCPECAGPGFLWAGADGSRTWNYEEILEL